LAFNVLGRFNNIDILTTSDLHVRVLRNYLTPNMGKVMLNAQDELNYSWEVDVPECEGESLLFSPYSFISQKVYSERIWGEKELN
jgi:hypothetical protein